MNKKIMGKLSFGYNDLVMPLEVAHKIQALLAEHAVRVDSLYCGSKNPTVYIELEYDVSPVTVPGVPDFDCKGIDYKALSEWRKIVTEREEGAPIMDPQDFAKLKGEE